MTDKNRLLRAIGDIDDKYITEILAEDAKGSGKVVKVPFNQKPVIKYMKYYLPAAAALVIVVACVKSGLFSGFGATGSASYDSAAPAATADAPDYAVNSASECAEEAEAMPMTDGFMDETAGMTDAGATNSDKDTVESSVNYLAPDGDVSIGMPNPFVECRTLAEAEQIAGFKFSVPDDLDRRYNTVIRAIDGSLIEMIYFDGDREVYRIRKGTDRDVSGDYNDYSISVCIDSANWAAELKGNEEGYTDCAVWVDDEGYGYSITAGEESLETAKVEYIIERLMQQ